MAKTNQTQFREFQAGQRVERLLAWLRRELQATMRTDHLDPIVDLVEWLLPQTGGTLQSIAWTKELVRLRDEAMRRRLRPAPPRRSRVTLRLVK